jgi:serine/threonine-protein kinase
MFDVCSSLALLHSRRLLHRDISPRNIRCTANGGAKLIDFGAMSAMSAGGGQLAGTPAFSAPEAVQRSAIDARTDLFSLGATMYFALTGRLAYAARTFAEALAAWHIKPEPPSHVVPEIPAALDDLVMSLLHVEPGLRPQSAFEVMQRLAAIAQLPRSRRRRAVAAAPCSCEAPPGSVVRACSTSARSRPRRAACSWCARGPTARTNHGR